MLIDIFTSPTPHYSTLHNYQKAHDLVHAAGLTFVKTRPHLHFEQPKNSHMPSLNCDLLFELDCKGKKTLLLIKFDQGDQEVNVELTICDPRETSYEIVRQGQLTVPKARCDKDVRIYRVHRHYLFVVHGPGRSVIIYDLCEMKVKGKIKFEVDHSWFPVSAQLRNIIVFVSTRENYVFDLDTIASAAQSDPAAIIHPLAKFSQPVLIVDDKIFSAELIGDRFALVLFCNQKLHMYTCHFGMVLRHHGKINVSWHFQAFDLPFIHSDLTDNTIKWIDLQRRNVHRNRQWQMLIFTDS